VRSLQVCPTHPPTRRRRAPCGALRMSGTTASVSGTTASVSGTIASVSGTIASVSGTIASVCSTRERVRHARAQPSQRINRFLDMHGTAGSKCALFAQLKTLQASHFTNASSPDSAQVRGVGGWGGGDDDVILSIDIILMIFN
jgi:hypothetical protein